MQTQARVYPTEASVINLHAKMNPSPENIHAMIGIAKQDITSNAKRFEDNVKQTKQDVTKFQSTHVIPPQEYHFLDHFPTLEQDELLMMKELCELKLKVINTMLIKKDGTLDVTEKLHRFLVSEYCAYLTNT